MTTTTTRQNSIEIEIDEDGNDTWDAMTTNIPATQDLFSEMVKNRVLEVFPGADVTIQRVESGSGCRVYFNGFDSRFPERDSENAETVMEIVKRISGDISDWAVAASATHWTGLLVTDRDGYECGTLGDLVRSAPANLDDAEIREGAIASWAWYFLSAEGERPDADTPRGPVLWDGFEQTLREASGYAS